jgi:hypothetical protein
MSGCVFKGVKNRFFVQNTEGGKWQRANAAIVSLGQNYLPLLPLQRSIVVSLLSFLATSAPDEGIATVNS